MKTLEYLAAGRPVVATSLPAVRWLDTDLVTLADTPDDFAASRGARAALARDPLLVRRRREFAARHSWASGPSASPGSWATGIATAARGGDL